MTLVYGYDVKSYNDRLLVAARKMADLGSRTVLPGAFLVNDIPLCKLPDPARERPIEETHCSETYSRVDLAAKL
jgi:hypothetical protein